MRKNRYSTVRAVMPPRFSRFLGRFAPLQLLLALIAPLSAVSFGHAQPAPRPCGAQLGLTIVLSSSWEQVSVNHPDVVCAFRSKGGGFPTLTVTREAPSSAASRRSVERRLATVTESYRAIGLSDARVKRVYQGYAPEEPLQLLLEYTTNSTPMSALIKVVDAQSGTFVLTALDRTNDIAASLPESETIAASFPGDDAAATTATPHSNPSVAEPFSLNHSTTWFLLWVGAAFVGAALVRILIARVRPSIRNRKS